MASGTEHEGTEDLPAPAKSDGTEAPELPLVAEDNYEDLQEVAHGGLGQVFRAWHRTMRRVVALKELLPGNQNAEARFIREALVTGRLEHPSIVPVYEAGRWPSGEPFYTMKLVSGRPLGELVRATPTLAGRMAFLPNVIAVADAIAYAHSRRVIHRDIKPNNVIVGQFGETVVIDWGLAKELGVADEPVAGTGKADGKSAGIDDSIGGEQTVLGEVLGTPAYMAPEQAMGMATDERADVWALGALLYFVLTGEPPLAPAAPRGRETATHALARDAATRAEEVVPTASTLSAGLPPSGVHARTPVPLVTRQADAPRELVAIVAKAMGTLPEERYPTAKQFADDLKKFQTGQLVSAHQYTPWALMRRWLRRHAALVIVVGVATAITLAAFGFSFARIVAARRAADVARAVAEARADDLVLLQARSALVEDPTATVAWLKLYPDRAPRWDDARRLLAEARARGVAQLVLRGHARGVIGVVPAADWLLSADGSGQLRRWSTTGAGGPQPVAAPTGATGSFALSPDGRLVALGLDGGGIVVQPVAGGPARELGAHRDGVGSMVFSPDGAWLASSSVDRTVRLWPIAGGEPRILVGHELETTGVAFAPDGALLASTSEDRSVRLWSLPAALSGAPPRVLETTTPAIGAAFSADGKRLVVAERGGVRLWDLSVEPPALLASRQRPGREVYAVAFTPAGQIIVGGAEGLELVDPMLATVARLDGHAGAVNTVALDRDGRHLWSGGADGSIRRWLLPERLGRALRDGNQPDGTGARPRVSPDGRWIAAPGADGSILVVDAAGSQRRLFTGHQGGVKEIAFAPDGQRLASLGLDRTIRRWDLASGESTVLATAASQAFRLRFAPDGVHLAYTEGFEDLSVIAVADGRVACRFRGRGNTGSEFTPDGRAIAFAEGPQLRLGSIDGCFAHTLYTHHGSIFGIAFTRDGGRVASASADRTIGSARLAGGVASEVRFLDGHRAGVYAVAFSANGELLASGDFDGEARVWRIADGQLRFPLRGHAQALLYLGFTPDDRLITGGADDVVRLWDGGTGEPLARLTGTGINGFGVAPDGSFLVAAGPHGVRWWSLGGYAPLPTGPAVRTWMDTQTSARIDPENRVISP